MRSEEKSLIKHWNCRRKKVFLRIDGNVPIKNGTILNDFRLRSLIPTLKLLQEKEAFVTIGTHIGNPQTKKDLLNLSTKPLQEWFKKKGFDNCTVLENLRFNPGEKGLSHSFAQQLAHTMDFYINDAWGTMHRNHTSITLLPKLFAKKNRSYGLLVEKEIQKLSRLKNLPHKPYLVLLGGNKLATKLLLLKQLIQEKSPTTVIVLPALAFTFLKASGQPVGLSKIDESLIPLAQKIIQLTNATETELIIPLDFTYFENNLHGILKRCNQKEIPDNGIGMSIGPRSLALFKRKIIEAQTIFFNGTMGISSNKETLKPLHELLHTIAQASGYRVVGGGSSILELEKLNLTTHIDFCSTGGGSTLKFITGEPLPGLQVL